MPYETILFATDGPIAAVTINRPEALNALNTKVFAELHELFERIGRDESIRVVVLKGAGEKAFVAGADIREMAGMSRTQAEARSWNGMRLYDRMRRLPQPIIASVQGYALGGGMLIALACDIRIASTAASFGYPEIKLGIFPGTGGTVLIDRLLGAAAARAICILGERLTAERACQLGIVSKLVPPERLEAETQAAAATVAGYSPLALRELKRALNASLELDFAAAREIEIDAYGAAFDSHDRQEGMNAFLEKRPPRFTGK
ncbi:MAG: enoyl-CoA hydratase/isomerase family protein [Reyranellaceae bacterium]